MAEGGDAVKLLFLLAYLSVPGFFLWALCPHTDYLTPAGSCRAFELAEGVSVAFCADW